MTNTLGGASGRTLSNAAYPLTSRIPVSEIPLDAPKPAAKTLLTELIADPIVAIWAMFLMVVLGLGVMFWMEHTAARHHAAIEGKLAELQQAIEARK